MISRLLMKLAPPWIVAALWLRWALTFDPATLAIAGMAAVVELTWWCQRIAREGIAREMTTGQPATLERWMHAHPAAVIVALVFLGVLIDLGRAVYAVGAFAWWAVGAPTVLVNRQRYQRAVALRRAAQAQQIIEMATEQSQVAAGASMRARALEQAGRALGLEPGQDRLPARQVLEARPAPVVELAPPAPALEVAQVAIVHGLVQTYADGSHRFDPMTTEPTS